MIHNNYVLHEKYILDNFVGGFKPGTRTFVREFKPQTISVAVDYSRYQEELAVVNPQKPLKITSSYP